MKKYLVIGNPIEHSLSPKLHNYWIRENNIDAVYEKKLLEEKNIKSIINEVKIGKIKGINVTVPFKKSVIPFLDRLTILAKETHSVNTVLIGDDGAIVGENTDAYGFCKAIKNTNYKVKDKIAFILGAGGVVSSIVWGLKSMGISKIYLSNRTKKNAEEIKKLFPDLKIVDWGESPEFDIIINATSLGLKQDDQIKLDYSKMGSNKLFYDVIYRPKKTNFLSEAKRCGNRIENGKLMFVYQAQLAFEIWHGIEPAVNKTVLELLNND